MDAKHDQSDLTCAADWASLVQLLTMGSRQLRRIFGQQTAALAINETQFLVLFACRQCDAGLCQSDLAVRAGLSTAQVSGLVEQLEHRGLLEVRRSTVDRRRRVCRASPAGAEVLEQGLKQLAPWLVKCVIRLAKWLKTSCNRRSAGCCGYPHRHSIHPKHQTP